MSGSPGWKGRKWRTTESHRLDQITTPQRLNASNHHQICLEYHSDNFNFVAQPVTTVCFSLVSEDRDHARGQILMTSQK